MQGEEYVGRLVGVFLCKALAVAAGPKAWIRVPIEEMLFLCVCVDMDPDFACSGAKHSFCSRERQLCPS